MNRLTVTLIVIIAVITSCNPRNNTGNTEQVSPLNLWNDGKIKSEILAFVKSVTDKTSANYISEKDRIAVFDMDGTILIEKPHYVLFDFTVRKMLEKISEDHSLKDKQPYKAVYEEDWGYFKSVGLFADDGLYSVLLYATDGFTNEQYTSEVEEYFYTVIDERYGVSYNKLVYAPVVQLIEYLKNNDFEVFIVSGSDPQFTRTFCEEAAGIPVNNVIGTTVLTKWVENEPNSYFVRQHEFIQPINDEAGKPVNILNKIGKVPVIAVGNSKGDYHMLEYTKNAPNSLRLLVNHDDSLREYSYNSDKMSKLCKDNDWLEISMKNDFKVIFEGL